MNTLEYTVTEPHSADALCRGTVADLMLDAHVIPQCGLIPPFEVVAAVFRSADSSGGGMSPGCKWHSFELSERDYWEAVARLEQFTLDELTARHRDPRITGEVRVDYDAPDTNDYAVWLQSLVCRGYLQGGPFREVRRC